MKYQLNDSNGFIYTFRAEDMRAAVKGVKDFLYSAWQKEANRIKKPIRVNVRIFLAEPIEQVSYNEFLEWIHLRILPKIQKPEPQRKEYR